jgi:LuxR family transcriptional regulator, maltose regulon positive regulatory protein
VVDLLDPVPALRARLALADGEVADAARWVQARGLDVGDPLRYPREREYLMLARLLVAQGDLEPALGLLERLRAEAAGEGRTGSLVEVRALQALALDATGDRAAALDAVAEAVALGAPEGYLRVFIDEGP